MTDNLVRQRCIAKAGEPGDCYRACIATITGIPINSLPNFNAVATAKGIHGSEHSLEMTRLARESLARYGLSLFDTYCNGDWPLEKALDYFSTYNIGVPVILHGLSKYAPDEHHTVIALDGKIVFDPSGAGISGPCLAGDGAWWFMDVIALAKPLRLLPMAETEVEQVTQVDRDAAAGVYRHFDPHVAGAGEDVLFDSYPVVQAFAAHRRAALGSVQERDGA